MVATKGFREVFRPYLESKLKHLWLDPTQVDDKDEFFYRYTTVWGMAKAAQEIFDWLEDRVKETEHLAKKEKGETVKKFDIGR